MRKRWKRVKALLLAAMMVVALPGCGSTEANNAAGTAKETTAAKETAAAQEDKEVESTENQQESVAAGADEGTEHEPVTITVWRCNMTDERTALCEELNKKFMEEYPWITVEFTSLPNSFNEKLEVSFEAGDAPDVFFHNGNVIAYAKNNYILPLDDLYENWENKDILLESAVESIRNLDRNEHKLYYLPEGNNINCVWLRSDWFKEKEMELPVTWDDLFKDIESLTDTSAGRYGVALRGGSGGADALEKMMYSYSGITQAFDEEGHSTMNDPKNVEFAERWLGQYGVNSAEGDIGNGWTELAAAFQSGKAGVIQHNTGSASGHMTAFDGDMTKFEAVPFPESSYSGDRVIPALEPSGPCISASCKNPDAAFIYAAYMVTGEAVSEIAQMFSQIPFDKTVLEYDWIQDTPWMKMGAELLLSDSTKFYEGTAFVTGSTAIRSNEIDPMVQAVMAGQMTAQEMCDTWAKLLEEAYNN